MNYLLLDTHNSQDDSMETQLSPIYNLTLLIENVN